MKKIVERTVIVLLLLSGCVSAKTPVCETSGCNGEICSEKGKMSISPCVVLPQHECLRKSKCEVQKEGKCGWTKTPDYEACMKRLQNVQK